MRCPWMQASPPQRPGVLLIRLVAVGIMTPPCVHGVTHYAVSTHLELASIGSQGGRPGSQSVHRVTTTSSSTVRTSVWTHPGYCSDGRPRSHDEPVTQKGTGGAR